MKLTRNTSVCAVLFLLVAVTVHAQTTVTIGALKDNTLYQQSSGSKSNGAGSGMFCGKNDNGNGQIRRAVVMFDVAATIPSCATITSVSLQLRMTRTNTNTETCTLHTVLADWGEAGSVAGGEQGGGASALPGDTTWLHTFSPGSLWASAGGDFTAGASGSLPVNQQSYYVWTSTSQLVADVQSWIDNPSSNFGFLLKGNEAGSGTAKRWATREHANTAYRPALTVIYTTAPTASVVTTGTGCMSSSGLPFTIAAAGNPSTGNPGFAIHITDGPPYLNCLVFFASGPTVAPWAIGPNCFGLLDPVSAVSFIDQGLSPLSVSLNWTGAYSLWMPLGPECTYAGQVMSVQAMVLDSSGPVTTQALTFTFGT